MKRYEFLAALQQELIRRGAAESSEICTFYDEMLNDMMEGGLLEEDAVARLGSPVDLAEKVMSEGVTAGAPKTESSQASEEPKRNTAGGWSSIFRDMIEGLISNTRENIRFSTSSVYQSYESRLDASGLDAIEIDWPRGEVLVVADEQGSEIRMVEKRPEDAQAMSFETPGRTLRIRCASPGVHLQKNKDLEVHLPISFSDRFTLLSLRTVSADVDLHDFQVHTLNLSTTSGDITARNLTAGSFSAAGASSDMELSLDAQDMDLKTNSGDIELRSAAGGSAAIRTVSGDMDIAGNYRSLHLQTVSGDLSFDGSCEEISAGSVSGEVELDLQDWPVQIQTFTTSGDVDIEVPSGRECAVQFHSVSGTLRTSGIRNPMPGNGTPEIQIRTVSGDARVHD
ncbi:MAG: DUF4097 family beta strand repeat protein [Oscillospiraceae bacterium]|nr:DUF4097 family beta strand repeat protein [Oscillospiraceae bacterium]